MTCPSARFTPRNFGCESRRFFELPPAFFCDILYNGLVGTSIQEKRQIFKSFLMDDTFFYSILILCIGIGSFGLGRYSMSQNVTQSQPASVIFHAQPAPSTTSPSVNTQTYVASKNSDKYHLPWCSGAKRITEENKIWFATKDEAKSAGYTPAGNCKGI